ncbi:MAG: arsenate reductase ArsC [Candidatus Omnitrophica bacterium]|nr:arsenate reductase ArsC [Candidatus Omnitrophota bacterium]
MKILFLCVENAGRSQMAEAFARRLAPAGVEIFSAGSRPAASVNPVVVEAMRERGLDLSGKTSQGLGALAKERFDVVVGMGCGDACPAPPGARTIVWEIPDPKGQPLETVRRIRDEIEGKVRELFS